MDEVDARREWCVDGGREPWSGYGGGRWCGEVDAHREWCVGRYRVREGGGKFSKFQNDFQNSKRFSRSGL